MLEVGTHLHHDFHSLIGLYWDKVDTMRGGVGWILCVSTSLFVALFEYLQCMVDIIGYSNNWITKTWTHVGSQAISCIIDSHYGRVKLNSINKCWKKWFNQFSLPPTQVKIIMYKIFYILERLYSWYLKISEKLNKSVIFL